MDVLNRLYDQTGKMPPALKDRPKLTESTNLYYEVFIDLASSRQSGEVPHPIAFSEVMAYCTELGLVERDIRFSYWRIIHACDLEVLKDYATDMKAKADALKNKSK